jgi:hypothetical protein
MVGGGCALASCGIWPDFPSRTGSGIDVQAIDGSTDATFSDVSTNDSRADATLSDIADGGDGAVDPCAAPVSPTLGGVFPLTLVGPQAMGIDSAGLIGVMSSSTGTSVVLGPPAALASMSLGVAVPGASVLGFGRPSEFIVLQATGAPDLFSIAVAAHVVTPIPPSPTFTAPPIALAVSATNRLAYVGETGVASVDVVDLNTNVSTSVSAPMPMTALAIDPMQTQVVGINAPTGQVYRFMLTGTGGLMAPTLIGSFAVIPGTGARSIAVDNCGIVYSVIVGRPMFVDRLLRSGVARADMLPGSIGQPSAIVVGRAPNANPNSVYVLDAPGARVVEISGIVP